MMKKIFIMLLILNSGVCLANPFFAGVVLGHMLEPFIPDLRLEYSKQKENSSVVFSWPIHYWFNTNENSNFFISKPKNLIIIIIIHIGCIYVSIINVSLTNLAILSFNAYCFNISNWLFVYKKVKNNIK